MSKLLSGAVQGFYGDASWLTTDGLTYLVAGFRKPAFARFLARHGTVSYALQLGVVGLELLAIIAAFRLRLQRLWGLALLVMHGRAQ
jgi:hypothetical protein